MVAATTAAGLFAALGPLSSATGDVATPGRGTSPAPRSSQVAIAGDQDTPRLAGEDRYATGVAIADDVFAGRERRTDAAVLARGDDFADALAGVPLAHHLDAPLLLTAPSELPTVTADALQRLLAPGATIHVLGGATAVSADVEERLRSDGWDVERHAGETRYGTAAAIAAILPASPVTYLASGVEPADALAVAPVAARQGAPVLLTQPEVLPEATRRALSDVPQVHIVGGEVAVGAAVASQLQRDHDVVRTAGPDRFATAVAIADQAPDPVEATAVASGRAWPDALTGAAHAAATSSVLLLTGTTQLPWVTAAELTRRQHVPVRIYGGEVAVAVPVEDDIERARASDPGSPVQTGLQPGRRVSQGHDLRLQFSHVVASADLVHDEYGERLSSSVDGDEVVVALPPVGAGQTVTVAGSVTDIDGRRRLLSETVSVVAATDAGSSPEGFTVAGGTGPVVGREGPVRTYTVEVEPATGLSIDEVLPAVAAALEDTERGWTARGERRLQRVDDPGLAHLRVVLATPGTVDEFCRRIGTNTAGIYSCWDGARAMLNLYRWHHGASDFDDLAVYRRYLVNHEVGHGLGQDHVACPASGAPAPIMMQQTKTVGDCVPNGWPYP